MIKIHQRFICLIFFMCAGWKVSAQKTDLSKLQQQVESTISKTCAASVFITDYNPATKQAYGGRYSGVVVNKEGIILTVAHATMPNQIYEVTFTDGKKCTATGLGRVSSIGVAMLKINEKGIWPIAEMGWSAILKANEPCISIAYPASFENRIPVVRFGYVAEVSSATQANRIRTTCLMEPGDSGGPVFDLSGRLIGMNNNVEMSLEANYEVPIDLYRKYWNALLQPEDYKDAPIGEFLSPDTIRKVAPVFSDIKLYGNSMVETEKKFGSTVIRIESAIDDKKIYALGTIINLNGSAYVLSKSSIVGKRAVLEISKDKLIETVISYRDERKDLVLLKVIGVSIQGIPYANIAKGATRQQELGKFLCSPLPNGEASWSVIGSAKFDLEAKFRAGYPVITPNHPASFFIGGKSKIRDGFSNVYIHDGRLTPAECGGPIFDLEGGFIGVNIARYSRTSNILLAASEIADFIKSAIFKR
ncbi:hypothetical protein DBR11_10880 [Pedobacter sp. HMWF019]|uniref:trypsin-like peptidase domain-containing protein n=1 Tax=Pedobacter sp. HMWF019 TaxID=2056856 RepID=UPI000D3379AA|nr:trypsin-like peptidase domain-containing protein [Pedobacter sp. HMWF019]PTT00068.1 hypothetical protein DBR11_10880 [Pedobacter sp. HMWF019]